MNNMNKTEKFVKKAISIHKELYLYNEVSYKDSKTKIIIFCKACNEYFEQRPDSHLAGYGCKKCGIKRYSSNSIDFIKKSKEIHGNEYSYDEVVYTNNKTLVLIKHIICCNNFYQTPDSHLSGRRCTICFPKFIRKDTRSFIESALRVHGNEYDYSNSEYVSADVKIEIKHKFCGNIFWQIPRSHIYGTGCPFCFKQNKILKEDFIKKSIKINSDEYDYSKVNYINVKSKIELIHKKCGNSFWQTPDNHLSKQQGCPYCNVSISIRGFYFSNKVNEKFKYDSTWELDRMSFYDCNDNVISWSRANDKIEYYDSYNKKNRIYLPDFKVIYKDKIVIEEIKGIVDQTSRDKIESAKKFYKNMNLGYVVLTKKNNEFISLDLDNLQVNNKSYLIKGK
jgi:hypothetical protein